MEVALGRAGQRHLGAQRGRRQLQREAKVLLEEEGVVAAYRVREAVNGGR